MTAPVGAAGVPVFAKLDVPTRAPMVAVIADAEGRAVPSPRGSAPDVPAPGSE